MQKIRVAVLRGGTSDEYEASLKTGATVLDHIPENIYQTQDILITREGVWHKNGVAVIPHDIISHTDVVFNALHGQYGQDGKVQHILELHGIPFTGSGAFASSLGMNSILLKEVFKREGIQTPPYRVVEKIPTFENIKDLFQTFSPPFIVRPASLRSMNVASDISSFVLSLEKIFAKEHKVIIEEYIKGIRAEVSVIDGYRENDLYALPPVEIGESDHIVPSNFTDMQKVNLENLARKVHKALGFRHYSSTNFIISPHRGIFVLNATSLPSLAESSIIDKALHAVGAPMSHFLDHILQRALDRK